MGWEKRRNGRVYYYRDRKAGGRRGHEYVGGGAAGAMADAADRAERAARARAAAERVTRVEAVLRVGREVAAAEVWVLLLARAAVVLAGRRVRCGELRRLPDARRDAA